jgi:polyhydroxyalkanoate synthesis regulator phasin
MDKMKSLKKGRITLSEGKKVLKGLISSLSENTKQKNEAETRFHIIDTLRY